MNKMYFTNVTMTLHLIRDQEYAQIPLGVSHAVKKSTQIKYPEPSAATTLCG